MFRRRPRSVALEPSKYAVLGGYDGRSYSKVAWLRVRSPGTSSLNGTVALSSGTISGGQRLTITGDAPTNANDHAGSWITLQSFAFASRHTVDGVPAIRTQVLAEGTSSTVTIP